jgi:thiamine-phosphate pyrophosphorylase
MPLEIPVQLPKPITYLITSGETAIPPTEDFARLLKLLSAAVSAGVSLIQLREKHLNAHALFELTSRAVAITRGSSTRLLVNDRADIARAAGADGVHLTTRSLETAVVRAAFGNDFLIGVSTHSIAEVREARAGGADFVVFGPVFPSPSKSNYGQPQGLEKLKMVVAEVTPFPVIALGGVDELSALDCIRAGASGIAAIRLFSECDNLETFVESLPQVTGD